jgi:hypothetical protein
MAPIRGTRFHGITFDLRGLPLDETTLAVLFNHVAKTARRKAPVLIAQGLSGPEAMALAATAGFSHAASTTPPQTDRGAAAS